MQKVTNTADSPNFEWLMGGNPNAIEAQEAQGQKEFVNSSQLPVKANGLKSSTAEEQYPKMGIKVVKKSEGDEIFFDVQLPKGWNIEYTDHSMWNKLIDDKGRTRASIFYKAAFYDRSSHIDFKHRYFWTTEYLERTEGEKFTPKYYCVIDAATGTQLLKTEITKEYSDDKLEQQVKDFLKTNFPNYEDVNAYWD